MLYSYFCLLQLTFYLRALSEKDCLGSLAVGVVGMY